MVRIPVADLERVPADTVDPFDLRFGYIEKIDGEFYRRTLLG